MTGTLNSATQSNSPFHTAETLTSFGFSVIPLSANKQAAIPWKTFQYRLPTSEELTSWFTASRHTNSAIITGRISRLIVLDIDQRERLVDFTRDCPDLLDTLIVQTKRGYHLYYRIPADLHVPTQRADGIDLQGEGAYVVAPGSVIDGHTYTPMTTYGQPYYIEERQITRLLRFMNRWNRQHSPMPSRQELALEEPQPKVDTPIVVNERTLTGDELVTLYRYSAPHEGRNHTLFRLACLARDRGFAFDQIVETLAHLHAMQQPAGEHRQEKYQTRYREAERTIASAFKRPPRPHKPRQQAIEQLSNPIREALLKQQWTFALRVLEGLRLLGVRPGQTFTLNQAVQMLAGRVGRDSVRKAVNLMIEQEKPLFEHIKSPLHPPNSVATNIGINATSQCVEVSSTKSAISLTAHRPTRYFIMPDNAELAAKLGVKHLPISDPLTLDDLSRAKTTRQALHAAFIKRRPGQYPVRLFGVRLGVSVRTIQRYNLAFPAIQSQAICIQTLIFWHNLNLIPDILPHKGFFLTDGSGKRYPAKLPIARMLLAKKQSVMLYRRVCNYWWWAEDTPSLPIQLQMTAPMRAGPPDPERRWPTFRILLDPVEQGRVSAASGSSQPAAASTKANRKQAGRIKREPAKRYSPGKTKQPRPSSQRIRSICDEVNRLSEGKGVSMSLKSVRRLVRRCGIEAVEAAVALMKQRHNIHNPPGFLSTVVRSNIVEQRMMG